MCKYAVQIQHSSKINMDQRRCPTIFRKCLGVESFSACRDSGGKATAALW